MKVFQKIFKILLYLLLSIAGIALVGYAFFLIHFSVVNSKAKSQLEEKSSLVENGYKFRDLNNNGKLDIYEDSRKDTDARVEDLLSQMTIEEKAGLMFNSIWVNMDIGDSLINQTHINNWSLPDLPTAKAYQDHHNNHNEHHNDYNNHDHN